MGATFHSICLFHYAVNSVLLVKVGHFMRPPLALPRKLVSYRKALARDQ
jgi:hypothetical protein